MHPHLQIIVLTMSGGVGTVVQAMRHGATDFLVKPVSPERIQISIENALKISTLTGELSRITRKVNGEMTFDDLIAVAPPMRNVVDLAKRAAASNIAVLLEGESGVGKEMIARAVQGSSERAGRPFVRIDCVVGVWLVFNEFFNNVTDRSGIGTPWTQPSAQPTHQRRAGVVAIAI